MNTYTIVVVSKEYRYVEVTAEDNADAEDKVWAQIDSVLNRKPDDYDTELYVEGYQPCTDAASYT